MGKGQKSYSHAEAYRRLKAAFDDAQSKNAKLRQMLARNISAGAALHLALVAMMQRHGETQTFGVDQMNVARDSIQRGTDVSFDGRSGALELRLVHATAPSGEPQKESK